MRFWAKDPEPQNGSSSLSGLQAPPVFSLFWGGCRRGSRRGSSHFVLPGNKGKATVLIMRSASFRFFSKGQILLLPGQKAVEVQGDTEKHSGLCTKVTAPTEEGQKCLTYVEPFTNLSDRVSLFPGVISSSSTYPEELRLHRSHIAAQPVETF